MQKPMSSYLVALAIGKYNKKVEYSKSGIPLEMYYYPENSLKVEPTYRYTKQMFDFLEDEIGYKGDDIGYKLNLKIKTTIDRYFEQSAQITNQIGSDIKRHLDTSETFISSLSKNSLNAASGVAKSISKIPVDSIKAAIFTAREGRE